MNTEVKEITINGVEYIQKGTEIQKPSGDYVIVRGDRSGVFFGQLESREGKEITLRNVRRIWYWDGAASISQLAKDGTSKPEDCKFPAPVYEILILDGIEILPCTEKASESILSVKEWSN